MLALMLMLGAAARLYVAPLTNNDAGIIVSLVNTIGLMVVAVVTTRTHTQVSQNSQKDPSRPTLKDKVSDAVDAGDRATHAATQAAWYASEAKIAADAVSYKLDEHIVKGHPQ